MDQRRWSRFFMQTGDLAPESRKAGTDKVTGDERRAYAQSFGVASK